MGSRPVRIGNGASDQLQLDIYGEAMNSIHALDSGALRDWGVGHEGWLRIVAMIDWLCEHWHDPDEGIWETRGGRRHFVYGQLMSWVALDRAIRMAASRSRPADVDRWARERDRIHAQIMTKGWNEQMGAFVQYEGGDVLDAALVQMPLVGFIVPNDPRWRSTMAAMDRTLVDDSLVYRYDPQASPDGLPGSEGTFSLCTFLYVDALARSGRLDDARTTFSKMLTYANHLGLYSEEIDPTGQQVGNFPQAFTHLALIAAVLRLDEQLTRRRRADDRVTTSDHGDAPGLGALPQHADARKALPDPQGWWAEVNSLDLAVYAAIAATPTPIVGRRLSPAGPGRRQLEAVDRECRSPGDHRGTGRPPRCGQRSRLGRCHLGCCQPGAQAARPPAPTRPRHPPRPDHPPGDDASHHLVPVGPRGLGVRLRHRRGQRGT